MNKTIRYLFFTIIWELSVFYFKWVPRKVCLWVKKCATNCLIQQVKDGSQLVYTVKIHPRKGWIEDHFMNYQGGEFIYDLNGNRAKWNGKLGSRIDFGNGPYAVIAVVENWSDFGWTGLAHMLKDTRELNKYLDRTRR